MSVGTFKALLAQAFGPTGFWVQETRVRERQTVLNWGCVHPAKGQAVLFGVAIAEFGSKESVFDLARDQLRRQMSGDP